MGHDERTKKIKNAFFKKRFYISLFILFPLLFFAFSIAAPLIFLVKLNSLSNRNIITSLDFTSVYNFVEGWTYVIGIIAFISGLVVAYGLIKPAKMVLKEISQDINVEALSSLGKEFAEIATSLKKYTSLLESITGGIIAVNRNAEITMVNPHACYILGCHETDVVGKKIETLFNISRDLRTVMQGESVEGELGILINNKNWTIGYTLSPILGRNSIDGAVLNFIDITKIKEMHYEMQKTEKLANIGSIAMEVAHEIRNPLASIKGLVQLIGEDIEHDNQKKNYIDVILKEVERLNRVVDALYEKRTSISGGDDLKEMIHRIVLLCGQTVKDKEVNITENFDPDIDKISVKDERLFHSIYNIVLNAYEAVNDNGSIIISTKKTSAGIIIEVISDSEISPKIEKEKIFNESVSTKGSGHGMGLKIARDSIKDLRGSINIESGSGKTKFTIQLPFTGQTTLS
ncbi:MAG: PAS domain S-box protein [Nitrospiraceae bacterium]|nr:PAS domain S-box protein [Nitrospiraceae bacterium]